MSKTYTNAEILDRLKSLEGLLLERVFETSYSESLRTYDLIDHLRSKAHDLGLEGEDTYAALIRDLEKLSSTIGGLINGNAASFSPQRVSNVFAAIACCFPTSRFRMEARSRNTIKF